MGVTYSFSANTKIKSSESNQNFTDAITDANQEPTHAFRAILTADQSNITKASWVQIVFNDDSTAPFFDLGGDFNEATGEFTVPITGYYILFANVNIDATGLDADIECRARIFNETTSLRLGDQSNVQGGAATNNFWTGNLSSGMVKLTAGDIIRVDAWIDTAGDTADINGDVGGQSTWFSGFMLGV